MEARPWLCKGKVMIEYNFFCEKKAKIIYILNGSRILKTIILHLVLYGCETWSLILREEHRLRTFFTQ
jgi:hypothetical protein